ncbi:hypothetical protein OHA33_18115 [Streptomyces sp. NBC_00562]|uniref:hypothetical protein n=1 Tax=Streptomyces sp. NBC_00562 TaxID=2975777 RepID=UPI002E801125|nr:hypothetical protein [Streptomyces sp. NBC_00562]WUC20629.1 hypothetical protein OHA33_18115 [Streptomyces sp. NBC_00562]
MTTPNNRKPGTTSLTKDIETPPASRAIATSCGRRTPAETRGNVISSADGTVHQAVRGRANASATTVGPAVAVWLPGTGQWPVGGHATGEAAAATTDR